MSRPDVSEFGSIDPATPHDSVNINELGNMLLDENEDIYQRMRAVFSLRNINSPASVEALGNAFSVKSALLRHEVAYVMGQMQNVAALPHLISRLEDYNEHVMVRHEAAEALGAIGEQSIRGILQQYANDESVEVSESCIVALKLLAAHEE